MPMKSKGYIPVGCHPKLQGYWARVWGESLPPNWHKTHSNKEWLKLWWEGHQERVEWESTPIQERGKK